jgi:hypothetical protein
MDGRGAVGKVSSPFAAAPEQGDSGNIDTHTLGHVDIDVADNRKRGHGRLGSLDLDVAKIQIKIPDNGDGERATT